MLLDETISLSLTGNSTTGLSVLLEPAFTKANVAVDDYVHNTFIVNAGTTATAIDLGKIATASYLMVICDAPLEVTITQTTDRTVDVNDFLLMNSTFTALKIANPGIVDVNVTVLVAGNRIANPGTPGIYSE